MRSVGVWFSCKWTEIHRHPDVKGGLSRVDVGAKHLGIAEVKMGWRSFSPFHVYLLLAEGKTLTLRVNARGNEKAD